MPDKGIVKITPVKPIKGKSDIRVNQTTPTELKKRIIQEQELRGLLKDFISKNLVEGTDYGKIHIAKNCQDKYNCKNKNHFSKPSLFKAGGEKFGSLFHLRATFKKDNETWEMAGSKIGLFCYVCYLVDTTGAVVGEGRGSCSAAEKMGNENNAIKIAQKRAKIDAILSTGSLSDFFTQDVEDMKFDPEVQTNVTPKKPQISLITNPQKIKITELLKEKARTTTDLKTYVLKKFKVEDLNKLTTTQASDVIKKISELPNPKPIEEDIDIDLDEVDAGMKEAEKEK